MVAISYLIGCILPYVAIGVLVIGLLYRLVNWSRAPQHLHWELFPYPEKLAARTCELIVEVLALKSLYRHNRSLWWPSLLMHWGIYLVFFWFVFLALGAPGTSYLGPVGAAATSLGSFLLLLGRLLGHNLRDFSKPIDYLNLLLLFLTCIFGLASGFFFEGAAVQGYVWGLLALSPLMPPRSYLVTILLLEVFFFYLPFGRMAHFAAKYFTYHRVKWGEPE